MSERKSRTVKVANLPESKALCNITNKPIALIFFAWIVFVWMLYLVEVKILAIPFGIYCLIITFKEEKKIFSGHKDYLVIYDERNLKECEIYYLSEIKKWYFKQKLFNPSITLFLQDGEKFIFCKYVGSEIYNYLKKVMPDKEVQPKRR